MHNGFLNMAAEKMSKSIGNVLLLHDLVQATPGEVVRWALLSAHYRQPLDWTDPAGAVSRKLDRLYGALLRAAAVAVRRTNRPAEFLEAVEDDLNTPGAMAVLFGRRNRRGPDGGPAVATAKLLAAAKILGVLQPLRKPGSRAVDEGLKAEVEALLADASRPAPTRTGAKPTASATS